MLKVIKAISCKGLEYDIEGCVYNLPFGDVKLKVFVHLVGNSLILTDFRSGCKIANISALTLGLYKVQMSNREKAEITLSKIIVKYGFSKVKAIIFDKTSIN